FAGDGGEQPGAPSGTNVDSGYGPTSTRSLVRLNANLHLPGNVNVYVPRQSVRLTARSHRRTDVCRGVASRTTTGAVSFPRTAIVAPAPAVGELGVTTRRCGVAALAPTPLIARATTAQAARRMFPSLLPALEHASMTPSPCA